MKRIYESKSSMRAIWSLWKHKKDKRPATMKLQSFPTPSLVAMLIMAKTGLLYRHQHVFQLLKTVWSQSIMDKVATRVQMRYNLKSWKLCYSRRQKVKNRYFNRQNGNICCFCRLTQWILGAKMGQSVIFGDLNNENLFFKALKSWKTVILGAKKWKIRYFKRQRGKIWNFLGLKKWKPVFYGA